MLNTNQTRQLIKHQSDTTAYKYRTDNHSSLITNIRQTMALKKKTKKTTVKKSNMTVKEHSSIRTAQKQISDDFFADANPSEVTDTYWIYATRQKGKYPNSGANTGKWLIFVSIDNIDIVWKKIKIATENGLLGGASKVATARPNPSATNSNMKVICVYTYDYTDKDDVMRIREELRKIGIENKIPYKTDSATRQGQYANRGNTRISIYYE